MIYQSEPVKRAHQFAHSVLRAGQVLPQLTAAQEAGSVVAVLRAVQGGFYRAVGAMMTIKADGAVVGALSAGCVDQDIAHHAQNVRQTGEVQLLRYGAGSPFADLTLPCGGAIDVELWPADALALQEPLAKIAARQSAQLDFPSGWDVPILPDLQLALFGQNEEAELLAALAQSAGYGVRVNLAASEFAHWVDEHTAVTLLFHNHEHEDAVLRQAVDSPAYWIGALGSERTHVARMERLRAAGMPEVQLMRIKGPIGLIPAQRDPRSLAISVLADIVAAGSCI